MNPGSANEARLCRFEVAGSIGERQLTLLGSAGVEVAARSAGSTILSGWLASGELDHVLTVVRDLGLELIGFRAGPPVHDDPGPGVESGP